MIKPEFIRITFLGLTAHKHKTVLIKLTSITSMVSEPNTSVYQVIYSVGGVTKGINVPQHIFQRVEELWTLPQPFRPGKLVTLHCDIVN